VKRHRPDLSSAALGCIIVLIALAVMMRRAAGLFDGPWWIAIAAIVLGIGLIPWPVTDRSGPDIDDRGDPANGT